MDDARKRRYIEALREMQRSPRETIEAEIASSRGLSVEERGQRLVAVCRAAWAVLRSRPDFHEAVAYQDPLPADFAAKWDALRARYRARQQEKTDGSG
ncbi:MAG: hypothetical protein HOP18_08275 [Deltaproteobacteria bacterium]|nr:hypothetical protein [Deltaproteobacteria bacterium]